METANDRARELVRHAVPTPGCIVTATDEPPDVTPGCPACDRITYWRGPHPGLGETQVEYDRDPVRAARVATGLRVVRTVQRRGAAPRVVHVLPGHITREAAARKLYAYVDVLAHRPLHRPDGSYLWQAALCDGCEPDHRAAWYDSIWSPAYDTWAGGLLAGDRGEGKADESPF